MVTLLKARSLSDLFRISFTRTSVIFNDVPFRW
jgi:hypothetical protein